MKLPEIKILIRQTEDWTQKSLKPRHWHMSADMSRQFHAAIEEWDETYDLTFFEYRQKLKEIAISTWPDIDQVVGLNKVEDGVLYLVTDDDDWYAPQIVDFLSENYSGEQLVKWQHTVINATEGRLECCDWSDIEVGSNSYALLGGCKGFKEAFGAHHKLSLDLTYNERLSIYIRHPGSHYHLVRKQAPVLFRDIDEYLVPMDIDWAHEPLQKLSDLLRDVKRSRKSKIYPHQLPQTTSLQKKDYKVLLRQSEDWSKVGHGFLHHAKSPDDQTNFRKKVEEWNHRYSLSYNEFRNRLKDIAKGTWPDLEIVTAASEFDPNTMYLVTDDDDWYAPNIVDFLSKNDNGKELITWRSLTLKVDIAPTQVQDWSSVNIGSNSYALRRGTKSHKEFKNKVYAHQKLPRDIDFDECLSLYIRHPASLYRLIHQGESVDFDFPTRVNVPNHLEWARPSAQQLYHLLRDTLRSRKIKGPLPLKDQ